MLDLLPAGAKMLTALAPPALPRLPALQAKHSSLWEGKEATEEPQLLLQLDQL